MEVRNPFRVNYETFSGEFHEYFRAKFASYGKQIAMVDSVSGMVWRYSEIWELVEKCAEQLSEIGVIADTRVSIITSKTCKVIFVQLACSILGAVACCISPNLSIDKIWNLIGAANGSICVTESQFQLKIESKSYRVLHRNKKIKIKLIDELTCIDQQIDYVPPRVISFGSDTHRVRGISRVKSKSCSSSPNQCIRDCNEQDAINGRKAGSNYMIFFSDGAVNHQRPTKIHHQSIITNIIQISVEVFASPIKAQNILLGHPMHHIFGTVYAYYALACGSTLVCSQKLDVNSFFTTVEDQKINVALLLPPILNEIHKISHIVKDVKSLHSILTCGLPVEQDVMISVKEKLELEDIRQVYGSTYACGICTFSKFGCTNYKSVGIPLPAMLMKIVNSETNELCGPYQSGALHVSSPHIFSLIEENEKWQSLTTNANKTYLNTGDFAYYDYAGYIYVICKIKNLIKSKGKMVRPEKIESLVLENPAVKDCAIIGSCDKSVTDAPTAFVVKSEKYPHLAPSDIRRHIPAKLTDLRGGVFFVDKIPRSDSGKILRRLLKDNWYCNRLIGLQKSQSSMALLGINTANASKSRQSPELGKSKSRNVIHLSHNR